MQTAPTFAATYAARQCAAIARRRAALATVQAARASVANAARASLRNRTGLGRTLARLRLAIARRHYAAAHAAYMALPY